MVIVFVFKSVLLRWDPFILAHGIQLQKRKPTPKRAGSLHKAPRKQGGADNCAQHSVDARLRTLLAISLSSLESCDEHVPRGMTVDACNESRRDPTRNGKIAAVR
jgi:hypothetical protein